MQNGGMTESPDPGEFGAFLKARRAQLTPHAVGLPDTGSHRKVKGLRREEMARLAAISVDYYTRLEQGRVPASASVLATLARALRLDEDQQTYLYAIAGKTDARPRRRRAAQKVRPAMRRTPRAQRRARHQALPAPAGRRPHPRLRRLEQSGRERSTTDGRHRGTRNSYHDALRILASWTADGRDSRIATTEEGDRV
jgi:transcriptional regulator with XRE-family HTH domain